LNCALVVVDFTKASIAIVKVVLKKSFCANFEIVFTLKFFLL